MNGCFNDGLANVDQKIAALLDGYEPGHTLPQALYCDADIFGVDLHRVMYRNWLFVGHVSQLPAAGDFITFEIGGESLVLVRSRAGDIRALFNVCRHRGARICERRAGHASAFVCPYHQWTYDLEGSLVAARNTGAGFDARHYSLAQASTRVIEGFIFACLHESPPEFDAVEQDLRSHLALHELTNTRVCHTRRYIVRANWKLLDENARECFHCPGSHPEYCRAVISAGATTPGELERAARVQAEKESEWRSLGFDVQQKPFAPGTWHSVSRYALRPGVLTESLDGAPVAPLLGRLPTRDAGVVGIGIYPSLLAEVCSDHAVTLRFTPRAAEITEVEMSWLVRADAEEGQDYDLAAMTAVWEATAEQDWRLCELNQLGVRSSRYRPGPYSPNEWGCRHFVEWYLKEVVDGRDSKRSCSHSILTET